MKNRLTIAQVNKMDEEIRQRFEQLEKRVSQLESKSLSVVEKETAEKPQSIQEFLAESAALGNVQKTVVVGYYLEKQRGKSYFTSKDIEAIFREARVPVSKNISMDISRAIQKGWIMEYSKNEKGPSTYITTSKGERVIKARFKEGKEDEA
jgi:hypothetical protein